MEISKDGSQAFTKHTYLLEFFFIVIPLLSHACLCDIMHYSMPSFPVLHYLPECAQTHVHQVDDAIQPSHPLSPPSLPALNLSQDQGLFQ